MVSYTLHKEEEVEDIETTLPMTSTICAYDHSQGHSQNGFGWFRQTTF